MTVAGFLLLLAAAALGLAVVGWLGVRLVYGWRLAGRRADLRRLMQETEAFARDSRKLEEEVREIRESLDHLRRDMGGARRRLDGHEAGRYDLIIPQGNPAPDRRLFVFELMAAGPADMARADRRLRLDDRLWAHRLLVEIWAEDGRSAARQVNDSFDIRLGVGRATLVEERFDVAG